MEAIELTLGEYLEFFMPKVHETEPEDALWPPGIFGVCASLLVKSGSYGRVLESWPKASDSESLSEKEDWPKAARDVGQRWREAWEKRLRKEVSDDPQEVVQSWQRLLAHRSKPLSSLRHEREPVSPGAVPDEAWSDAMRLLAYADEACSPVGIAAPKDSDAELRAFLNRTTAFLSAVGPQGEKRSGASLCDKIHPSRLRVLPKYHTSSSGLTIRSLSHNLCIATPCEVIPRFGLTRLRYKRRDKPFNILVVPWPFRIERDQFETVKGGVGSGVLSLGVGYFTYHAPRGPQKIPIENRVDHLIECAKRESGEIHMVVLPECALSVEEDIALSARFREKHPKTFLVCGYGSAGNSTHFGTNRVRMLRYPIELDQAKQHRWRLDRRQIQQYALGGYLSPTKAYYEHISVDQREMCFAVFGDFSIATLICEDLARPDPAGDLIRSVGPNLVVALLMDGPQLQGRWPGRYASVLADDPGSSVLSVTSLGMTELSRPLGGATNRSRVIGLWKDAETGAREIEIDPGAQAVVITTMLESREEWTADGRSDIDESLPMRGGSIYPQFFSTHSIRADLESPTVFEAS